MVCDICDIPKDNSKIDSPKNLEVGIMSMLFGGGNKDAIKSFHENGAVVLDVRSVEEFADGHIKGSKNIPLPVLSSRISEVKAYGKPVLVCCLSGGRSATGTKILNGAGIEAINGGGWRALAGIINN